MARQEELCRELAESKGWPVAELYTDNDLSAYSGKPRPGYRAMLDAIAHGSVDAVLVVDVDRLTRTPAELEEFITLADTHGTALANVSGDLDLATSDGRFRARIMGAVARQESEKKSERLKRERRQAALAGKPQGGRRSFGYDRDGMTVRASEGTYVREAVDRVLGGEGLRRIVADWNARGVATVYGKPWQVTSLRTLVTGPRIAGLRSYHGEIVGGAAWPAIISRDEHERVQAILGDPRRHQAGRPAVNLLTSMVRCGRCGGRMSSSKRRDGSRRYICHPGEGTGQCGRVGVAADPLEVEVRDRVIAVVSSSPLPAPPDDTGDASAELQHVEGKLAELAEDFAADRISRAEWLAAREGLQQRAEAAHKRLGADTHHAALRDVPRDAEGLRAAWESGDVDWRRRLLTAVLDRVIVHPAPAGFRRFTPDRVEVIWRD